MWLPWLYTWTRCSCRPEEGIYGRSRVHWKLAFKMGSEFISSCWAIGIDGMVSVVCIFPQVAGLRLSLWSCNTSMYELLPYLALCLIMLTRWSLTFR